MEKHLKNIGEIIKKFCQEKEFLQAYTEITGVVATNMHGSLSIMTNWENNTTIEDIKQMKRKLEDQIQTYLVTNRIIKELHIETEKRGSFAFSGFNIYFKEELTISI